MTRIARGLRDNPAMRLPKVDRPRNLIAALLLAAVCAPGAAAEVPVAADALVHARDGAVHGCGVRLTGGEPVAGGASAWFDVSFNVFRRGIALAQSIAYEIRHSGYEGDARPARVPVQSAWLKTPGGSARMGENLQRLDTLIYPLVLDDALALFRAVASGETLTLGIKRWDQRVASVYAGAPALSDDARRRIEACLARLAE